MLPAFAAIENPVDVTAQSIRDASILGRTAAQLLADPAIGSLVVSIVAGAPRFAMDKVRAILLRHQRPQEAGGGRHLGDDLPLPAGIHRRVPRARPADLPLAGARAARDGARHLVRPRRDGGGAQGCGDRVSATPARRGGGCRNTWARTFSASLGIPVPAGELARDVDGAREIAQQIGYPVALKAQAAALAHKSDAGGVILNVADEATLAQAWETLHANIRSRGPT